MPNRNAEFAGRLMNSDRESGWIFRAELAWIPFLHRRQSHSAAQSSSSSDWSVLSVRGRSRTSNPFLQGRGRAPAAKLRIQPRVFLAALFAESAASERFPRGEHFLFHRRLPLRKVPSHRASPASGRSYNQCVRVRESIARRDW